MHSKIAKVGMSFLWKIVFADIEVQFETRKEELASDLQTYICVKITSVHEEPTVLN